LSAPPESKEETQAAAEPPVPFLQIFGMRQFWITLAVGIAVNICWHFYRIWLTLFLNVDLKFSQREIQWLLIGFFIAADLGSMASGYMTRRLVYAGYSVERSRKLVMLGSSLLCLLSAPAVLLMDPWVTLPLIYVVAIGAMGGFPIFFALAQAISPRHTSLCLGIFGCAGWLAVTAINPLAGAVVDRIGTFTPSLIAVGCVPLVGALILFWWPEPAPVSLPPLPDEPGERAIADISAHGKGS
jgi:ACS family hexuronate transporter-like MFS transporter